MYWGLRSHKCIYIVRELSKTLLSDGEVQLNRGGSFARSLALGASALAEAAATTQSEPEGFFTPGERDGLWGLITPVRIKVFRLLEAGC